MVSIENYQGKGNGEYPFPPSDINPKQKQTDWWMRQYCEAIYYCWANGKAYTSFDEVALIRENRLYMEGNQSSDRYKELFLGKQDGIQENEFMRKGLMNIDWTPPVVAVKYVNVVKSMFEDANFDYVCNALDEKSADEKEQKKWDLWMKSKMKNDLEDINKLVGEELTEIPEKLPVNLQELDFFDQIGEFKLAKELAFEAGLQDILDRCNAPEKKRKIIDDFLAAGKACIKDYVDPVTQKVEYEYCDITRTIISYRNSDYNNPQYGAFLRDYTIAELEQYIDLSQNELMDIAKGFIGYGNNPDSYDLFDRYWTQLDERSGRYRWYDMTVVVMEAEFEDVDINYKTKKIRSDGKEMIYNEPYKNNKKPRIYNTDTRKTYNHKTRVRYRCNWLVGTKYVFDYGYQYDVPRPTPKMTGSSFHFYHVGKPYIEVMKPHIDQMALAFYRIQNSIAEAPESGFFMEYSALTNVSLGDNKKLAPLDLIRIGKRKGLWIYKATTHYGQVNPNIGRPVEYFEGGIGRTLQENIQIFEWNRQLIQELIGLPPISSGGVEKRSTTLGEQQILFASSTNAVKHFFTGYKELMRGLGINAVLRMQIVAKHNEKGYEVLKRSIGYAKAEILRIGKADAVSDIGIEILPVLGAQEKERIDQAAMQSMQIGKSGGIGITLADYMTVTRMLKAGLIRQAEIYLTYREKKAEEMRIKMQRENMQLDQQGQQQLAAQKVQGDMQMLSAETQADMQKTQQEKDLDLRNNMVEKGIELGSEGTE